MHTRRIGNWRSCSGDSCKGSRRSRWWQTRTAVAAVSIWPNGGELDKSWLIRADVGVDPGLVPGHSGVDSRQIGPSTAKTKTDNSRLNPLVSLFVDHRTSRVALRRWRGGVWGCQKMANIQVWTSSRVPDTSLFLLPEHRHRSCCQWLNQLHLGSYTVCSQPLEPLLLAGF